MSDHPHATQERAAEKPVTVEGVAMLIALVTVMVMLALSVLAVLFAMAYVAIAGIWGALS